MTNTQAIQQSLDGQSDVRLDSSPRHASPLQLTSRDLALVTSIYEYGGVLTTVQLASLFWPPDIEKRMAHIGLTRDQVDSLLSQYDKSSINHLLELWKWLGKINRMKTEGPSKTDGKLVEYLEVVKKATPQQIVLLDSLLLQAKQQTSAIWLEQTLVKGEPLPDVFINRPQFPSDFVSSACKSRLKALANFGVLEPVEQPTKLSEGRAQTCWFLTKRGRNLLAQMRQVRHTELDWKQAGSYGTLHLGHRLLLNDLRIAIELGCRLRGYIVRRWIDDNQLKRLLGSEKVQLVRLERDGTTNQRREVVENYALKIPDGYFWIDLGDGQRRHCFVELDNQTLTISDNRDSAKDYAQKIRTVSAFYRSGRYKEVFAEADGYMWYLTITTGSQRRLNNLKQTAEKVIGLHNNAVDRYWFTTMSQVVTWEDYFAASVFTTIWHRGGKGNLWSLDDQYEKDE